MALEVLRRGVPFDLEFLFCGFRDCFVRCVFGGGFGVGPPVYSQNRRLPPSQMGAQMGAYLPPIVPQSPVMPGPRQGRYFKGFVGS